MYCGVVSENEKQGKRTMLITIFTPVYNRAKLLPRLLASLRAQNSKNFEWILIDDASIDGSWEYMESIREIKEFSVRIFRQPHGGKHRAINKAVDLAEGEYFFIVDSDDCLRPDAIEKINSWLDDIPVYANKIAGVAGLCESFTGKIWGGKPKCTSDYITCSNLDRAKYNLLGDKAEIYRTDVLRSHKFPEFAGENFVTEAVCWDAIAADGYVLRWYNEPIYVADYLEDGLTKSGSNSLAGHRNNFQGFCYYVKQSQKLYSLIRFVPLLWSYHLTCNSIGMPLAERGTHIGISFEKYLFYLMLVPFVGVYIKTDRLLRR